MPGIEFRGISIAAQLPALIEGGYDPWFCWVDGTDRSPFDEVVGAVAEFSRAKLQNGVLVGESLGGLVAAAAIVELSDGNELTSLRGAALVNPATSCVSPRGCSAHGSRRRRGCDVDSPWRRVGCRGRDVDSPWKRVAADARGRDVDIPWSRDATTRRG